MEEEPLEAWQTPDGLEQFVSLDSQHTVSVSLLLKGVSRNMRSTFSLFQDGGNGFFASGTSMLQCGRQFPQSTGVIWMSRRQLFIRATKLKEFPPHDRASLFEPFHSSFWESRVQSCCCCLPHQIGSWEKFKVAVSQREANPCEFREEANRSRISMQERVMAYTLSARYPIL